MINNNAINKDLTIEIILNKIKNRIKQLLLEGMSLINCQRPCGSVVAITTNNYNTIYFSEIQYSLLDWKKNKKIIKFIKTYYTIDNKFIEKIKLFYECEKM